MHRVSIISVILINYSIIIASQDIAPFNHTKTCDQSNPRSMCICIKKSILKLRSNLDNGMPLLNIPSLDPLLVSEINISLESGLNVEAIFRNVTIRGFSKFRLRSVRCDALSDKFQMKIWIPELIINADYDIKGKVMMLPIKGNGKAFGNFSDIDGVLSTKLDRLQIYENEHYKVNFLQIKFNIGGAQVSLSNLFNGKDQDLAVTMNQFINENWRIVAAEVRPTLEKIIGELMIEVADKFFAAFPISNLFIP